MSNIQSIRNQIQKMKNKFKKLTPEKQSAFLNLLQKVADEQTDEEMKSVLYDIHKFFKDYSELLNKPTVEAASDLEKLLRPDAATQEFHEAFEKDRLEIVSGLETMQAARDKEFAPFVEMMQERQTEQISGLEKVKNADEDL